ncbi:hypothetical protein Tco_0216262 [Tanacetum coccineum]
MGLVVPMDSLILEEDPEEKDLGVLEECIKRGGVLRYLMLMLEVISLVDEAQERQNNDLIFDSGVLEVDVMNVETKVDGKDDQSKKLDDSTAGEADTTVGIDDTAGIGDLVAACSYN